MKPKSSCGFDGISIKILKAIKEVLIEPILIIVNQTLHTGIFLDKLKIAKLNPIYKKDENTQFTNYRPISLLLILSRIFERVIFNQLYSSFKHINFFIVANMALRFTKTDKHFVNTRG